MMTLEEKNTFSVELLSPPSGSKGLLHKHRNSNLWLFHYAYA